MIIIKKIAKLFVVFLTTAILFTSCPIEYVPFVEPPPPPFVPPPGATSVSGEAPGFAAEQGGPDLVKVTLYFYPGPVFYGLVVDASAESGYPFNDDYAEFYYPIVDWRYLVSQGIGIAAPPPLPPIFPEDFDTPPVPPQFAPYVDAFAGSTLTINALTQAALYALEDLPDNFFD